MPLLPAEPCLFPENLFAEPASPDEVWWVLHTRPRAEKTVARSLFTDHVPFFLPLYESSRRVGGRLQTSHLPLFASYLFLRTGEEGRIRALETNQIVNCIRVPNQLLLQEQLAAVHRVMVSGSPIGPEARLVPGAEVRIARGPLTGLTGKVVSNGRRLTFVVEVQMLNQGVGIEIESWMLEAVSGEEQETGNRRQGTGDKLMD